MSENRPKVGVGVFVLNGEKILFGKRINSHGNGTWSLPGGHLEFGESVEDCARREVMEETGLTVKNLRPATFTNDIFADEGKHYITLFVLADYISGEPKIMEPDKCKIWEWFTWENLPKPLFLPIENLIKQRYIPK